MKIEAFYISPGHDFYGRYGQERLNHGDDSPQSINCVAGKGIEGDRFFDYKENFKGQATFFSVEVADALREIVPDPYFENAAFRRNIFVRGVDLNTLIGKRFKIGSIEFEGTQEATPCEWMDSSVGPGARAFMEGKGGLRVRILSSGTLEVGELDLLILG
ncbi:MAG: MOSC domain-containing protein [Opitutales bacterium]|jgi:MOSC domain-containing protein YiiM|nr:MOSC domain-containing protein [Opitutales bacterium]